VGVVVTNISDPFVAGVVRGIEDAASEQGFSVFLANSNADPNQEIRVVRSFEERRVDGIRRHILSSRSALRSAADAQTDPDCPAQQPASKRVRALGDDRTTPRAAWKPRGT